MSRKKNVCCLFLFVFVSLISFQALGKSGKSSSPVILELLQKIANSYAGITSFRAEFTQKKTSKLLQKPAITKGEIVFKKPSQVLLKFEKPYNISIYLKNKKVTKIDYTDGSYSLISLKKHKSNLMNFLNISKTFKFLDKYFYVDKLNTKGDLLYIICLPKKRRVKKKLKIVELWLDPETFIFKKIHIEEPDNTITEVTLTNTKINDKVDETVFDFSLKGLEKKEWRQ
jgi:outer membrane lipoprotein-sorting protein